MTSLSKQESQTLNEASRLSAPFVYEIIRRDGEEELNRSLVSLMWSGIAGGVVISFSVFAMGAFRAHLPDTMWRPLVESFGYSLGFILVILGRLQLFTENTITTVIPLYTHFSLSKLSSVSRLWFVVFLANLLGAFVAALFYSMSGVLETNIKQAVLEISQHLSHMPSDIIFIRGIPAGILIAALVWIMPSTNNGLFAILVVTYILSLSGLTHVVAGSVEIFFLIFEEKVSLMQAIFGVILPSFAGNVVGGTAVFTLMVWGQVRKETIPEA